MVQLDLIGIGSGAQEHLTGAARTAIATADMILIPYKGEEKADLADLRRALIDALCPASTDVRYIDMPVRDPKLPYLERVDAWHQQIARRWQEQISNAPAAARVALLVWGDPSLYDSTLRIADQIDPKPVVRVLPGITSLQLLTAAHAVPLNSLGGEVMITTGRQLMAKGWPDRVDHIVVMLDGQMAFQTLAHQSKFFIWWGAFLGMEEEVLISGALDQVSDTIVAQRTAAKVRHGWIMDTYLIKRIS
ncbi:MAG: precorrin-6A synthase (deacetylating) [Roseobacter sp.]